MPNPQQPELRRNDKGAGTPEDSQALKAAEPTGGGGRAHGTDRGNKGGGKGGGTPPEQQPDHPA
ncbi:MULTISPECIES: hypothetical protein [Streptomyces]|uniref:Uncharacterized protein n=2 Tax=Streptomyces TaxID=1883 RepID=A0A124EDE6_9ACTN|nr:MULTISPECIES: hypothetical protein [Streptomyces]KUH40533.1 hypothetical protein ATE80_01180 [Streptomyces kanasensis]UUS33696.1 hypothetical protein NRO40_24635 [Streptomyces changanensis]